MVTEASDQRELAEENTRIQGELSAVIALTRTLGSPLKLENMLNRAIDDVVTHMDICMGGLCLIDEQTRTLTCKAAKGLDPKAVTSLINEGGAESKAWSAARSRDPLFLEMAFLKGQVEGLGLADAPFGAFIPICSRGRALGVMALFGRDPDQLHPEKIKLLMAMGESVGAAIENARLNEESRRAAEHFEAVTDIIAAVHSTVDLRQVFSKVVNGIRRLVDFDRASISLLEESSHRVRIFALAAGETMEMKEGDAQDLEGSVTSWLIANRVPLILGEHNKYPGLLTGRFVGTRGLKSALVIPLFSEDAVVGNLNLSSKESNKYSDRDLETLKPVGEQIAIAIHKWRLYEQLKFQASEIAAAYEQLKLAQESLIASEKLRGLGEMASGVAHDVNNHLAAIVLNAKLLSTQVKSRAAEDTIQVIRQAAMDCAHTVGRIREFARLRTGEAFTEVDVNQIVNDVITLTRPKWKSEAEQLGKKISLTTQLNDVAPISGSPEDLRQALVNILINAADAISERGKIVISTQVERKWVCISIKDTGSGMSREVKQKIFDPFFTTKGSGSGLGLSIALAIVSKHGGEILVDTKKGAGTTFKIRLPKGPGDQEEEPVVPSKSKKSNILIVEDEASIRDALRRILVAEGHHVGVAPNGPEGIARYKLGKYDIVITDLGLPGISGWEVAKAVKSVGLQSMVIMMTGWGEQLDEEKLRESGVDLVLAKPFDSNDVLKVIEQGAQLKLKM